MGPFCFLDSIFVRDQLFFLYLAAEQLQFGVATDHALGQSFSLLLFTERNAATFAFLGLPFLFLSRYSFFFFGLFTKVSFFFFGLMAQVSFIFFGLYQFCMETTFGVALTSICAARRCLELLFYFDLCVTP